MGDNLDLMTSNFYKKNKSSAQEPIVIDESEKINNDVIISGLIECNDWIPHSMDKYDS